MAEETLDEKAARYKAENLKKFQEAVVKKSDQLFVLYDVQYKIESEKLKLSEPSMTREQRERAASIRAIIILMASLEVRADEMNMFAMLG